MVKPKLPALKIYDCFLFNGEFDVLEIRLNELWDIVDVFVIVESNQTFSGMQKPYSFSQSAARFSKFNDKIRYIKITEENNTFASAWDREAFQRNSIEKGLFDAKPNDLILISDVDEIPSSHSVKQMKSISSCDYFLFKMKFSYFYFNYRNISGPESDYIWTVGLKFAKLSEIKIEELRKNRTKLINSHVFDNGGWHFSYLGNRKQVIKKIKSFSHQEYNNLEFLDNVDINSTIMKNEDFLGRVDFVWGRVSDLDLPKYVLKNKSRFIKYYAPTASYLPKFLYNLLYKIIFLLHSIILNSIFRVRILRVKLKAGSNPVIILPYVNDCDKKLIRQNFFLDKKVGNSLPFFYWKDTQRLGPETSFEYLWNLFPKNDVILLHSDMRPTSDDENNKWYQELCTYSNLLTRAGAIGCNLIYPKSQGDGNTTVQYGGGFFQDGKIDYTKGESSLIPNLMDVREVDWVTFGGVLLKRVAINACGQIDKNYSWAYVIDVDFSLHLKSIGFLLYQVPTMLIHEESQSTKAYSHDKVYLDQVKHNFNYFYIKWSDFIKNLDRAK